MKIIIVQVADNIDLNIFPKGSTTKINTTDGVVVTSFDIMDISHPHTAKTTVSATTTII